MLHDGVGFALSRRSALKVLGGLTLGAHVCAQEGLAAQEPEIKDIEWPLVKGRFRHVLYPPGHKAANMAPEQWYVNDHCFYVADDKRIHFFGISNPFRKEDHYGPGSHRHIAHATAWEPFGPWEVHDHALELPADTRDNIGAPYVIKQGQSYLMCFGYNKGFGIARSDNLFTWEIVVPQHSIKFGKATRDPCIIRLDDGQLLVYATDSHEGFSCVHTGVSSDGKNWQAQQPALMTDIPCSWGAIESPFVVRRHNVYYLFVNLSHHQYEETVVFASRDPRSFAWDKPLCTVFAHAAEIFCWKNKTYISHCGIEDQQWRAISAPNGLWLAELAWVRA